ncbi:MAG TPA: FAD-dependent oxidoreductase [Candidatus Limnocylindrales bacterium]|nr:FAD-dependent oxidoreductase [Candidatus Limnocylindrales bacterium]
MRSTARVVIVGGGVMGISLLYHLAEAGWTDAMLIEKAELTSGSTWHAAGQCPSFIADYTMAKVHAYGNALYPRLETMTGRPTGWHATGGIRFATTREELDHFKRVEGVAANIGFRMQVIGPDEIRRLNPFVTTRGVLAGAWTLDDGYVDPSSACNAMAAAARGMGATIVRHDLVTGIERLPSGEFRVATDQGDVTCEHVVNAAGCYADRVSAWLGVQTTFANMKHQYLVTEPVPEFVERDGELPVMRDPYASAYYRQELKAALIGIYEGRDTREAWKETGGPSWGASNELFEPELDRIMPNLERVMERMPLLAGVGIRKVVNGAISHTPDSNPLVGPAAGVRNFWLATGTGIGIAQGPGCGKYLAQWMIHGAAEINMLGLDPRRFGAFADEAYASAKAHREYWDMYRLIPPGEERSEGRPVRTTPLYDRLQAKGCVFTEGFGWERPKWFSPDGRAEAGSFRRNDVFDVVAAESRAVRERVGVFELPSFSKFDVSGSGAEAFLDRLCANRVSRRPGGIVLAHALTDAGRILTEFTITRLAGDRFYLLSGAVAHDRDLDLLRGSLSGGEDVTVTDVTESYDVLIVAGPRSRDVLSRLTAADLGNEAFPWLTGREIEVADIPVRALRINYVGELGWELHVPMARALDLYDAVWAAGEGSGIADFGLYAMNSLRLEKAYAGWGAELTNEVTPVEAGLDRFVRLDHDFVGRAAVAAAKERGVATHLVYLEVMADDSDAAGGEPVFADGKAIGVTTSGGYGHATGRSLAFAYVASGYETPGRDLAVELLGERCPATVLAGPVYDPDNLRLRA